MVPHSVPGAFQAFMIRSTRDFDLGPSSQTARRLIHGRTDTSFSPLDVYGQMIKACHDAGHHSQARIPIIEDLLQATDEQSIAMALAIPLRGDRMVLLVGTLPPENP